MRILRILGRIGLALAAGMTTAALADALDLSWLHFSDQNIGPLALGVGLLVLCGSFLRVSKTTGKDTDA